MTYAGERPGPPLDLFVDDVYVLSGAPGARRRLNVPPMPSAHLLVNLGDPVVLRDSDAAAPPLVLEGAWATGLWTRRFTIEYGSGVRVAGVHFKPWGLAPFAPLPPGELRDRWVPADAVWGPAIDRLRDDLAAAASAEAMPRLLAAWLRSRLGPPSSRGLELVHRTAADLERSWGSASVAHLADRAGVSGNRLAATYAAQVGVGPKRLARIYRFAHLMLSIDATRPVRWADLAREVGYFDQPHLINDFRGFTGLTPSDYLALRQRMPREAGFPLDLGPMPVE